MSELSKTWIPICVFPAARPHRRLSIQPSVRLSCGFIDCRRHEGHRGPITSSVRATEQRVVVESGTLELTVHRWRQYGNLEGRARTRFMREGGRESKERCTTAVLNGTRSGQLPWPETHPFVHSLVGNPARARVSESRRDHQSSSPTRRPLVKFDWFSPVKDGVRSFVPSFVFFLSTPSPAKSRADAAVECPAAGRQRNIQATAAMRRLPIRLSARLSVAPARSARN